MFALKMLAVLKVLGVAHAVRANTRLAPTDIENMLIPDFEKQLSQKKIKPLYLFLSEDPYLLNRSIDRLEKILKEKYPRLEKIRWNGTEQHPTQLRSELESFSFFSDYRLLIAASVEKSKELDLQEIVQIQQTSSSSTLILLTEKKEFFKKSSKLISDSESLIECLKPAAREIHSWAITFAEEEGKKLKMNDARVLTELIGTDLFSLYQQIKLLALYVGERKEIQSENIHQLFSEIAEKNVFSLTKAIAANEIELTFTLLRSLFGQGEVPLKLFALLIRHYRILLKVKLALRKRMNAKEMAQILKLPFFVIEESISQAQKIGWKKFFQIYQELEKTDLALKSSPLSSFMILEKMIWNLESDVKS